MCVLIYNIYLKLLILNTFKIMLIYLKLLLAYIKAIYPLFKIGSISQWASPVTQMLKNLPAIQETWIRYLGQEDPLDKEMTTHSSTFTWRIPWTEEPGKLQSTGSHRDRHDWLTLSLSIVLEVEVIVKILNTWYGTSADGIEQKTSPSE